VVWRRTGNGDTEVLLVHRPKYDDWSLPKGKCGEGEDDFACAVREVGEETGLRVEPGAELPTTRYHDAKGRPKVVRYWSMRALDGRFEPSDEVDEVRWVPLDDAGRELSYDHDREVLAALPAAWRP
jgi:8-oxo-dGTP diphosphatase